jgi:nucleoside-diphosphate-sugar epimerase
MDLSGKKILITGASGFVGSRICERLYLGSDAKATALIRNIGKASRIGRMRIHMVKGDVLDPVVMDRLIGDAEIVIHLVAGSRQSIVDGTRIVARLCRKHRVSRMVHMSSAAVYGIRPNEDHTSEDAPLRKTGNPYSDAKIEAEQIVRKETEKGLSSAVLRPRIIWGPYSSWVQSFYHQVTNGTFCLVDHGEGACNTIFIDNLVDATLLCMQHQQAIGNVFFVTDDERITWREFYGRWGSFLGEEIRFLSVDSSGYPSTGRKPGMMRETKAFLASPAWKTLLLEAPGLNRISKKAFGYLSGLPEDKKIWIKDLLGVDRPERNLQRRKDPLTAVDPARVQRESGKGYTNIEKIKTRIGYRPRVDFRTGSELTREWLAFAGFLG